MLLLDDMDRHGEGDLAGELCSKLWDIEGTDNVRPCERSRVTMRLTWLCVPSSLNGISGIFAVGMPNPERPGSLILGMGSFMLGIPGSLTFGIPASPGVGSPGACGPVVLFRLSPSEIISEEKPVWTPLGSTGL